MSANGKRSTLGSTNSDTVCQIRSRLQTINAIFEQVYKASAEPVVLVDATQRLAKSEHAGNIGCTLPNVSLLAGCIKRQPISPSRCTPSRPSFAPLRRRGFEHRHDVFGRHFSQDVMNGCHHVSAAVSQVMYPVAHVFRDI